MFDCMYTLSCPPLYTYLTLPYLLHSTLLYRWSVCACYGFCTFFLCLLFLSPCVLEEISNGILTTIFFVFGFAFRQNRVRKLVMDVFSIGGKMDLQISVIRMRIARERC